jgi:D-alanyl-D-alanine carboxypeptidase (penicillin-binding protein 5/6)
MSTKLTTSKNAAYANPVLQGATKVCLSEGQTITVEDALTAMITTSAGDAAILFAEKLAGSESAFAEMMTRRGREIGMEFSSFGNASGLPDPDNLSTSRELAILTEHIIRSYPEYLYLFKTRRFEFVNPITDFCRNWVRGHTISYNKLLFMMGGAEGMKTGHTTRGGYGVAASANRQGRRIIGVINGLAAKSHDALAAEAKRMLEYAYDNTFNKEIKAEIKVPVWYGVKNTVLARPKVPFALTFGNGTDLSGLRVVAAVPGKVPAPIAAGDEIGRVSATLSGLVIKSEKLYAAESVPKIRWFGRLARNIKYLLTGR